MLKLVFFPSYYPKPPLKILKFNNKCELVFTKKAPILKYGGRVFLTLKSIEMNYRMQLVSTIT